MGSICICWMNLIFQCLPVRWLSEGYRCGLWSLTHMVKAGPLHSSFMTFLGCNFLDYEYCLLYRGTLSQIGNNTLRYLAWGQHRVSIQQPWVWLLFPMPQYQTTRIWAPKRQWMDAAAAAAKSLQSCPTLCDPIDGSPPGSAVPGILQARTLEWVVISFSNAWKWKVKVKSLSRVRLFTTPWTAAYEAPPSMGFSRQEYWSGLPLPSPVNGYNSSNLCFCPSPAHRIWYLAQRLI